MGEHRGRCQGCQSEVSLGKQLASTTRSLLLEVDLWFSYSWQPAALVLESCRCRNHRFLGAGRLDEYLESLVRKLGSPHCPYYGLLASLGKVFGITEKLRLERRHGNRFDSPDVSAIFKDSPIRGKLTHPGDIENGHARPSFLVAVGFIHPFLDFNIGLKVRKQQERVTEQERVH